MFLGGKLVRVCIILGNGCLRQPASCVLRFGNAQDFFFSLSKMASCLEGMNKAFRPGYPNICYEKPTLEHLSCISCVDDEIWLANNLTYQADFGLYMNHLFFY